MPLKLKHRYLFYVAVWWPNDANPAQQLDNFGKKQKQTSYYWVEITDTICEVNSITTKNVCWSFSCIRGNKETRQTWRGLRWERDLILEIIELAYFRETMSGVIFHLKTYLKLLMMIKCLWLQQYNILRMCERGLNKATSPSSSLLTFCW